MTIMLCQSWIFVSLMIEQLKMMWHRINGIIRWLFKLLVYVYIFHLFCQLWKIKPESIVYQHLNIHLNILNRVFFFHFLLILFHSFVCLVCFDAPFTSIYPTSTTVSVESWWITPMNNKQIFPNRFSFCLYQLIIKEICIIEKFVWNNLISNQWLFVTHMTAKSILFQLMLLSFSC